MKISIEGDFEELKTVLWGSLQGLFNQTKMYADQAAASASKADSAARNAEMSWEEIKKLKGA